MPKSKKVKKSVKKKSAKPVKKPKSMKLPKPVGAVTHFYGEIKVAIVKFKKPLKVGSKVWFKGSTTDFEETIKSMQYDHKAIASAPKNKEVGIKVKGRVREGDEVYEAK